MVGQGMLSGRGERPGGYTAAVLSRFLRHLFSHPHPLSLSPRQQLSHCNTLCFSAGRSALFALSFLVSVLILLIMAAAVSSPILCVVLFPSP